LAVVFAPDSQEAVPVRDNRGVADILVADPASVRPAAADNREAAAVDDFDNRVVVLGTTLLKVVEQYRLAVYP
jgi:hypothetical protein